jgi:hypothetical protein
MWLLTGPFDGKFGQDTSFQSVYVLHLCPNYLHSRPMSESKLLRTNKSYTLGRKDQPLVIASKKISKDHCDIIVGDYTVDDVVRWLSTYFTIST